MVQIIDGKTLSQEIKQSVINKTSKLKELGKEINLHVILVGEDPASVWYLESKQKMAKSIGVGFIAHRLDESTETETILTLIDELNHDSNVHGIMVELPLPKHVDSFAVVNAVDYNKDVDGLHPMNTGLMNQGKESIIPNTPLAVMRLLDYADISIEGKHAVVIGRSNIVGKPVAQLLLQKHATVTNCHSRTQNLEEIARQADILVVAIGKIGFVNKHFVTKNSIVIDVGTNVNEDGKLVGDVHYEEVAPLVQAITPVPGGVGPVTNIILFEQLIDRNM